MRVLAEGVETEPQLRFMVRYGCDEIQGYLTSRPTTPEEVETWVMQRSDLRPVTLLQNLAKWNVLVVEDEPVEAELMALLLQDAGYGTYLVADLEGALAVMGKERIDLIVSDHYLTETTGVEVLARLRRLFPDVPRIMVSGAEERDVVVDALNRAGIRAFLPKPVEPQSLLNAIHRLLDKPETGLGVGV
jgi:CheY-like chemotaxis protein